MYNTDCLMISACKTVSYHAKACASDDWRRRERVYDIVWAAGIFAEIKLIRCEKISDKCEIINY